jgi:hypothetical protein
MILAPFGQNGRNGGKKVCHFCLDRAEPYPLIPAIPASFEGLRCPYRLILGRRLITFRTFPGRISAPETLQRAPRSPRMISVLRDSHDCVGFLRSAGPRGFQAYDAAGQPLGLFQDKAAAVEAITAASS